MYSDPCAYKNSVYTRYNATETFEVRAPISFPMLPHSCYYRHRFLIVGFVLTV